MTIWYIVKTNDDHILYVCVGTASNQHVLEAGAECGTSGNALNSDKLHYHHHHHHHHLFHSIGSTEYKFTRNIEHVKVYTR